jgi:hypothetical protein
MMTTYTYITNIPISSNKPSVDQPNMQTNTNSINSIIGTDHLTFGTATGTQIDGMHKVIRQVTGAGTQNLIRSGEGAIYTNTPTNIATINQVIAGQYTPDTTGGTADTQLFNLTAGNIISQLTGFAFATPTSNQSDGYAWVGGILIQWGTVITALNTSSIVYKDRFPGAIPFPNNCFNVQATLVTTGAPSLTPGCIAIKNAGGFSNTGFNWNATNITSFSGFFWFAVGN